MTTPVTESGCGFRLCPNPVKRGGLCHGHYMQQYRGKVLTPLQPRGDRRPSLVRDAWGRKECQVCTQWLDVDQFHKDPKLADGLSRQCSRCNNLSRFKLTRTTYEAMLARQDGHCAFCPKPHTEADPLRVDHDHACCPGRSSCGACVRWLLCNGCNSGLGQFGENVNAMLAAVAALRAWRSR